MNYTARTIDGMAENAGGGVKFLRLRLQAEDTAWNPTSTNTRLHGPAVVDYTKYADGGWRACVVAAEDGPEKWVPEAIAEQEAYLARRRAEG